MKDSIEKLVDAFIESIPEQIDREQIREAAKSPQPGDLPTSLIGADSTESEEQLERLIADMNAGQKVKLALFGNKSARAILIRDSKNRQIPLFVLENARITENEIQEFARNTNLSDQVLRAISNNPDWMKNYSIKLSIISNPKTPIDASVKWVKYLQTNDLRRLMKSKNIPQVVATQCRRIIESK